MPHRKPRPHNPKKRRKRSRQIRWAPLFWKLDMANTSNLSFVAVAIESVLWRSKLAAFHARHSPQLTAPLQVVEHWLIVEPPPPYSQRPFCGPVPPQPSTPSAPGICAQRYPNYLGICHVRRRPPREGAPTSYGSVLSQPRAVAPGWGDVSPRASRRRPTRSASSLGGNI